MPTSYNTLTVEKTDHIAEVILDRPEKGNAMSPQFFDEIGEVFPRIDDDDEVRVILLRAEGDAFSYGLDLTEAMADLGPHLQGGLAGDRLELRELIVDLQRKVGAPARCSKPVVAAVQGWCIGGGLDLLSTCDIRLCSADATFSLREARIGIVADLGSLQRLPNIIGDAATRELALTAKDIDAERALQLGLVSDVLDTTEQLTRRAREEARTIASLSPLVVQGVKHVLDRRDEARIQDDLEYVATWNSAFLASKDLGEAISAFFEKRQPEFTGE